MRSQNLFTFSHSVVVASSILSHVPQAIARTESEENHWFLKYDHGSNWCFPLKFWWQMNETTYMNHFVNVFEDGDKIIIDAFHYETYPRPLENVNGNGNFRNWKPTCVVPPRSFTLAFFLGLQRLSISDSEEPFAPWMVKSRRKRSAHGLSSCLTSIQTFLAVVISLCTSWLRYILSITVTYRRSEKCRQNLDHRDATLLIPRLIWILEKWMSGPRVIITMLESHYSFHVNQTPFLSLTVW